MQGISNGLSGLRQYFEYLRDFKLCGFWSSFMLLWTYEEKQRLRNPGKVFRIIFITNVYGISLFCVIFCVFILCTLFQWRKQRCSMNQSVILGNTNKNWFHACCHVPVRLFSNIKPFISKHLRTFMCPLFGMVGVMEISSIKKSMKMYIHHTGLVCDKSSLEYMHLTHATPIICSCDTHHSIPLVHNGLI